MTTRIDGLREAAAQVAAQNGAFDGAVAEERAAALELLDLAVAEVQPVLQVLSSRLRRLVSSRGCPQHGVAAGTHEYQPDDLRGVEIPGTNVMLSEGGAWFIDGAEACDERDCTRWHWIPIDREMMLRHVKVETLLVGLADVMGRQLEGNKAQRTKQSEVRARKLRAVADLLRKDG